MSKKIATAIGLTDEQADRAAKLFAKDDTIDFDDTAEMRTVKMVRARLLQACGHSPQEAFDLEPEGVALLIQNPSLGTHTTALLVMALLSWQTERIRALEVELEIAKEGDNLPPLNFNH